MKNHTTFGKRLLAFALALVMVLSYVPGTAIAEETSTPEAVPVKYFKAVLNREVVEQTPEDEPAGEENPSEAAGDENTGEQDPSQGAEGETTETEPVPTVYKYAVTATLGEEAISAENLKISWFTGLLTNLDETTTVEPVAKDTTELADTTEAVMTVSVEYEGMIILLSNETEETAQVTATWDLQAPTGWNTPMYVGIPVAVNPAAFNYNKHSFGSAPAAYFVNNDYVSYDEETGLVASKTSDSEIEIFRQTIGTADVVYAEYVANAKIDWPELNTKFVIGDKEYSGTTKWFDDDQTVTITVSNASLVDKTYLPIVKDSDGKVCEWTAPDPEEKTWTTSVNLTETTTIKVGGDQLDVQIDKDAPEITNAFGYIKDGMAIVNFTVTPSASGIESVLVNKETVDASPENKYEAKTTVDESGKVTIQVTGKNGKPVEATVTPQAGLSVAITPPKTLAGSTKYVAQDSYATIQVTGASKPGSTYALNAAESYVKNNGENVPVDWNYIEAGDVWETTVDVPDGGLNNLYVFVKDTYRTAQATLGGEYKFDITAPVVTVSKDASASATLDGVDYYQEEVTFTVSISDETVLDTNKLSVQYKLDGDEKYTPADLKTADGGKTYTADITIKDGQKLVAMKIAAMDDSDNAATLVDSGDILFTEMEYKGNAIEVDETNPDVKFTISDNVTSFVKKDDKVFAYVDAPVTSADEGNATVTVTATVEDKNLLSKAALSELNPGWSSEDGKVWTRSWDVANHQTKTIEFSFLVKDNANRVSEEAKSINASSRSGGLEMVSTLALDRAEDGTYSGILCVDRRYPSSGSDDAPPVLTLTSTATKQYKGVDIFKDTYSFDVIVTDSSANGADSGVASVTWALEDAAAGMTICENPAEIAADGKYTISGEIPAGSEAANVKLKITVTDNVGNAYTYEKVFHVDNKAPVVTVKNESEEIPHEVGNTDYYKNPVSLTITVKDEFIGMEGFTSSVIQTGGNLEQNGNEYTVTVENGMTLTDIVLSAQDAMGNEAVAVEAENISFKGMGYAGNDIMVNGQTPVVTIEWGVEEGGIQVDSESTSYFDKPVTFTFKVEDDNLEGGRASVTYTLEGKADPIEVSLMDKEASFTVDYGQVLTGFEIEVVDASGVYAETNSQSVPVKLQGEKIEYNGKKIAIDNDMPSVTVTKSTGNFKGDLDDRDYYNGEVTYNISISDNFLEEGLYSGNVTVYYEDGHHEEIELSFVNSDNNTVAATDTLNASFTIGDKTSNGDTTSNNVKYAKPVEYFTIKFSDNVGKIVQVPSTSDAEGRTSFKYNENEQFYYYGGKTIVVDTTNPVVTAELTAKPTDEEDPKKFTIESFYMKDGNFYAYLSPSVTKEGWFSKLFSAGESEEPAKVTLTFTLEESNPDAKKLQEAGWVLNETDNKWTRTWETTVAKNAIGVLEFELTTVDMAGNVPDLDVDVRTEADKTEGDYAHTMTLKPDKETGVYSGKIFIDRKTPMPKEPNISLNAGTGKYHDAEGKELFNGNFTFTLEVTDNYDLKEIDENGEEKIVASEVGIRSIHWSLDDGLKDVSFLNEAQDVAIIPNDSNTYKIDIEIIGDENETNNATLTVTVVDFVGNTYTYTRVFSVDNRGSRVKVEKKVESGEYIQSLKATDLDAIGTDYYNGEVTYYVHVEDQNLDEENTKVQYTLADGSTAEVKLTSRDNDRLEAIAGSFTLTNDQVLTDIQIIAPDVPENTSSSLTVVDPDNIENRELTSFALEDEKYTWRYSGNNVAVDMTTPEVTISKSGASYVQTGNDEINYFNGDIEFMVEVKDDFLTSGVEGKQKLILNYTIERIVNGKTEEETFEVNLSSENSEWSDTSNTVPGANQYSYTIKVTNGEVLKKVVVQVTDNAGNAVVAKDIQVSDPDADKTGYNGLSFTDDTKVKTCTSTAKFAVDTDPAKVTVVKNGEPVAQTVDNRSYHAGPVTYAITIEDTFLNFIDEDSNTKAIVVINYLDKDPETIELLSMNNDRAVTKATTSDKYEYQLKLNDGQAIESIDVLVCDNAGNYTKGIAVTDETGEAVEGTSGKKTNFKYVYNKDTNFNEYKGTSTIVDTSAPTADLEITGNVEQFYVRDGVAYVRLKNPNSAASGVLGNLTDETITLTLTVCDKNITLDLNSESNYIVKTNLQTDDGKWSGHTGINTDSIVTYTKEIKVPSDTTGVMKLDLTVRDMAANSIKLEGINLVPINGTTVKDLVKVDENGRITGNVSVDRRRPSSTDDYAPPKIEIEPSIQPTKARNGKDLFAGEFDFTLLVNDGEKSENNSGLSVVSWEITDNRKDSDYVTKDKQKKLQGEDVYENKFIIPVRVNRAGESNDVTLSITVVDNVGNTTTYVKEFAVDNQAPRISVTYTDTVLPGYEMFFRADRTANITLTDINFNPDTTTITTEVTPSEWTPVDEENGVWRCSCSYTVDGEYHLAINSTDLAENITEDTDVNYGNYPAAKHFFVDKTAPVITVTYNPAQYKGIDGMGVEYYDTELNTTVSIRELNFEDDDVTADFGGRNQLSAWGGAGDMHTASATFTEGNEYSFSIDYSDKAGNPAVGYKSETFSVDLDAPTITVTRGNLNDGLTIVQDDLNLSFTINDAEENLKNHTIKVTRLNNAFQEEPINGIDFYKVTGEGSRTTVVIDFTAIAKLKENDGIYTIYVSAEDYAGQVTTYPEVTLSLNRFGSTFMTDDAFTTEFLTPSSNGQVYNQTVDGKLVIKEINPNRVWQDSNNKSKDTTGSVITISVNGVSTVLKRDVDYTVDEDKNGNGRFTWYTYTYEIDPSIFYDNGEVVDGRYTILLYGEDEAGNMNTNESNEYGSVQKDANGEYTGKVEFTLDHMAPVIAVTGIEAKETYDSAFERMQITISDNSPSGIVVYLDDELVDQYDSLVGLSENDVWVAYDGETGNYILNVTEKTSRQSVKIVATDAAGNSSEYAVEDFLITTKTIVQLFNNPIFLGGLGILGVLGVTIPIPIIKKKRAAAKNNNQKV